MEVTMAFGKAVGNKFQIGTSELRIGPMAKANQLTGVNSVGLLQSAAVKFQQDSVDLEGGFPKTLVDTAIVKTNITVESQAYEYSRQNIKVMLNEGVDATTVVEVTGLTVGATLISAAEFDTSLTLSGIALAAGDLIVVYPPGEPENLTIIKVATVVAATITTKAKITFNASLYPLLFALPAGSVFYRANQIGLGKSVGTNYFTLDILGTDSKGNPKGFKFWKVAVSGGMDYSFSSDSYAVTALNFKVLQPSVADYTTGDLVNLAGIIPSHPFGMFFGG
jgi:hypothetical protein